MRILANEVYDNLEVIHRFFKDVFNWEIPDNKGKTIVTTINYGKDFDNTVFGMAKSLFWEMETE